MNVQVILQHFPAGNECWFSLKLSIILHNSYFLVNYLGCYYCRVVILGDGSKEKLPVIQIRMHLAQHGTLKDTLMKKVFSF